MKIKTNFVQMIVDVVDEKPYYGILYFDPRDDEYHIGYNSFSFENTFGWFVENFEPMEGGHADPITNLKEELKVRCAEISEMKCHLKNVHDERSKIGLELEQALKRIDELHGKIEFYKGQVDAYQYCMNCRR